MKMAWRDGKASGRKLLLFMASIVLGIAAVVSIQSFGTNLSDSIQSQSKSMMGADFIIDSSQPATEKVQAIMDSLGGAKGKEINFASMAAFPKNEGTKLVQVRGIDGGFPFYGAMETTPLAAASEYQKKGGALVDATLMLQFDLKVGDSVKIGNALLPISGSLNSIPGRSAISTTVAPIVLIPYPFIKETGLLQAGSRIEYQYYFVATPKQDLVALDKALDPILDAENSDIDTHSDTSRRMGRRYENFGKFLNLVAFIALLLGCVGIASAIHIYIMEKLRAVAILKCIGATRKQTFLIYLIQIVFLGLIGGIIGTSVGVGLQQLSPIVLQEFLPVDVEIALSLPAIVMGVMLGLLMSVLFALLPLTNTWYVSPLQALRINEVASGRSRKTSAVILTAIFVLIFLFALWLIQDWLYALAFVSGILVTFLLLAGIATVSMKGIKRFFPNSVDYCTRQSLLNLFRPRNQTLILILAIGVGTFLLSTLYFTKDILLSKLAFDEGSDSANMILLDVQSDQRKEVANTIIPMGMPVIEDIPIITMRVHSINEKTVNDIRKDTTSQVGRWVLNHEFRVTYRNSLIDSETIKEGKWYGEASNQDLIPISVAENFANDAQVQIGDVVVFNVQGLLINTVIGSIREVDWGRLQLNFSIVFPNGVLEKAPQFNVISTHTPNESSSAKLQQKLVSKFPNISIIDLRQMLTILENILNKISWVINFIALFSIITGIIVLIGAVRNSKFQRIRESVLLRTLGAKNSQILRITALEYVFLGVLGSLSGIVLALIGSVLLAVFFFKIDYAISPMPFLVLLPVITFLVVVIGLLNSRSVLNSPPLQVLRKEGR